MRRENRVPGEGGGLRAVLVFSDLIKNKKTRIQLVGRLGSTELSPSPPKRPSICHGMTAPNLRSGQDSWWHKFMKDEGTCNFNFNWEDYSVNSSHKVSIFPFRSIISLLIFLPSFFSFVLSVFQAVSCSSVWQLRIIWLRRKLPFTCISCSKDCNTCITRTSCTWMLR